MLKPSHAIDVFPVRIVKDEPTEIPAWALVPLGRDLYEEDIAVLTEAKTLDKGMTYVAGALEDTASYLTEPRVQFSSSVSHSFLPDDMITVQVTSNDELFSATYHRPSFAGEKPENQNKVYPHYSQIDQLRELIKIKNTKTISGNAIFHYMRDRGLVFWHRFDEVRPEGEPRLTEIGEKEYAALTPGLLAELG